MYWYDDSGTPAAVAALRAAVPQLSYWHPLLSMPIVYQPKTLPLSVSELVVAPETMPPLVRITPALRH